MQFRVQCRDKKNIFWLAAKFFWVKLVVNFFSPLCCFKLSYSHEEGGGLPYLVIKLVQKENMKFWGEISVSDRNVKSNNTQFVKSKWIHKINLPLFIAEERVFVIIAD